MSAWGLGWSSGDRENITNRAREKRLLYGRRLLERGRPGAPEVVAPCGADEVTERREPDGRLRRCVGDRGRVAGKHGGHVREEEEAKRFDEALGGGIAKLLSVSVRVDGREGASRVLREDSRFSPFDQLPLGLQDTFGGFLRRDKERCGECR